MPDYPLGLQGREFPYDVKTVADHWWPKGLQRLWADQAGCISLIRPSGEVKSAKPPQKGTKKKGFAQKRGGHRVYLGRSPWNHTFEPEFNEVDNSGPLTVNRINRHLESADQESYDPTAADITTDTIVKLCFSLMLRSPAFRHRYSRVGDTIGLESNEEIGKANISQFWSLARRIDLKECNSGSLLLLHAKDSEFCFGDGLCETIFTRPLSWRPEGNKWIADLSGEAFVPLLPNLCAYLYFERGGRGTKTSILPVTSTIVNEVNEFTQVYSKDQLFFRAIAPILTSEYLVCQHSTVSHERRPLIPALRAFIII